MGDKCEKCGADINDSTQDCTNCGFRVREVRQFRRIVALEGAIESWRSLSINSEDENKRLRDIIASCHKALNQAVNTEGGLDGSDGMAMLDAIEVVMPSLKPWRVWLKAKGDD